MCNPFPGIVVSKKPVPSERRAFRSSLCAVRYAPLSEESSSVGSRPRLSVGSCLPSPFGLTEITSFPLKMPLAHNQRGAIRLPAVAVDPQDRYALSCQSGFHSGYLSPATSMNFCLQCGHELSIPSSTFSFSNSIATLERQQRYTPPCGIRVSDSLTYVPFPPRRA